MIEKSVWGETSYKKFPPINNPKKLFESPLGGAWGSSKNLFSKIILNEMQG